MDAFLKKPLPRALGCASALFACLCMGPQAAQASSANCASQDASIPEDARSTPRKRLLKLHSGEVLRGNTRWRSDHWEIARDGKWISLRAGLVRSMRDDAEARRESRLRARKVGPQDHAARAALASWMIDEGLVSEALGELNQVLAKQPDHGAATALLAAAPIPRPKGGNPRENPAAFARRLFAAAISSAPAQRELCILALGELRDVQSGRAFLLDFLRRELLAVRVLRRATAAHALRRLLPGEGIRDLLRRCALDTSRPVRESAALALFVSGEAGVIEPLVRALGSDSRAVRTNAAESLGAVGFPLAIPSLVTHFASLTQSGGGGVSPSTAHIYIGTQCAYLGDFDVEIAQAASIADPMVKIGDSGVVLDARLAGISGFTYALERRTVREALKKLSGANPGSAPADWQAWWAESQAAQDAPEPQAGAR
jgi:HEAT repeat protein